MLRKFNPEGVAASPAYSQGAEATSPQRILFVSGQVGIRRDGSIAEGVAEQARIAVENLNSVLADAGMSIDDVAKFTIYLTDESNLEGFMTSGISLPSPPPAATLLFVKALASPQLLIEIEAVAVR
jgi:enamine deaminase RidA (YjgF/YER057c/UK114 family)